ncbi:RING finger domain-containing protein [Trichophyton interdigitale]|uniref:RING-type E3 ubiquitin transferase n=1 Tax=Trichophyton interdigitale TaxID=101480 RepID=A0A9P5CXQ9_9EURO|nr:RING finger [Trichophyton interdigitale]KAF3900611.1 RING finger [Trichophyton interdigitale]KAG8211555.1 RING finger domain-containing protein [Trichophyton interdigitale]
MRLAAYTGTSIVLAAGVALRALHQRSNFYSAAVFLSQNNANLMILTNLCLLMSGYTLFGLQRLLYGPLRQIETEQLYEKAWFAVTETCLAMTIFRGELGAWFMVMFVALLAGKIWGWIGEGRVEILEQQPPANPRLFHTRLAVSLIISVLFNSQMLEYAIKTVLRQARPDMMVMFGFEFAVLTILSTSTMARYTLSLAEIYITRQQKQAKLAERRAEIRAERERILRQQAASGLLAPNVDNLPSEDDIDEMELDVSGWEEKGRWVFYLDLITDFLKLVVYLSFFAILFRFYGLPIHILRDVVVTMRSFAKRIIDFIRYRNATRDMNQRYPDATAEEIAREDVCIICREEMQPWIPAPAANDGAAAPARPVRPIPERLRAKKLPCGHLLHFACLRSWLERQQNCPTCRQPVTTGTQGNTRPFAGRGAAAGGQRAGDQQQGGNEAGAADGEIRRRMWFLNFGPVRIGFGAGRGDMLQNIDMGQGVQGQAAQAPAANQNQNPPPGGQAPRTGFGFGIDRPIAGNIPGSTSEFNHRDVQQVTQQLEHQVMQEINNLTNTAEQLQVIRALHHELIRLRTLQSNASAGTQNTTSPGSSRVQPNTTPAHPLTARTTPSGTSHSTTIRPSYSQSYTATNPHLTSIPSGDPRLPEGVSIPPGWTLVPLQRTLPLNQPIGSHNTAAGSANTNIPTATSPLSSSSAPASASTPSFPNHNHTTATITSHTVIPSQESGNIGVSSTGPANPPEFFMSGTTQPQSSQHTPAMDTPHDATNNTAPAPSLPSTSPQRELHGLPSRGASQWPEGQHENRSLFNNPLARSFPEQAERDREDEESDEDENEGENDEGDDDDDDSGNNENDSEGDSSTHSSVPKQKGRAATVEDDEAEDE